MPQSDRDLDYGAALPPGGRRQSHARAGIAPVAYGHLDHLKTHEVPGLSPT